MEDLLLQRLQIISRKLTTALSALSAPPSFVSDVCFVNAVSFVSTCADKICGSVSRPRGRRGVPFMMWILIRYTVECQGYKGHASPPPGQQLPMDVGLLF